MWPPAERGSTDVQRLSQSSRQTQIILVCALLYVIDSFLHWQEVSVSALGVTASAGASEWHGIGIVAALLGIAVLIWELARSADVRLELGALTPGLLSVGLALLLTLFTVIAFLDKSDFRHWPEWLGLVLSIVIGVAALARGREEGIDMSDVVALRDSIDSTHRPEEGEQPPPAAG